MVLTQKIASDQGGGRWTSPVVGLGGGTFGQKKSYKRNHSLGFQHAHRRASLLSSLPAVEVSPRGAPRLAAIGQPEGAVVAGMGAAVMPIMGYKPVVV